MGAGAMGQLGGMVLGQVNSAIDDQRDYNTYEKIATNNMKRAREMGQFNYDMAMKGWRETNYGPQVEQMKKAGLNVGLMYKGAGAGGQLGPSGQQGAKGDKFGNGGQGTKGMAIGLQGMSKAEEIENIKADTEVKKATKENVEANTEKTKGVDTDRGRQEIEESGNRIRKLVQEVENGKAKAELDKVLTKLNGELIHKTKADVEYLRAQIENIGYRNEVDSQIIDELVELTVLDVAEQKLINAKIGIDSEAVIQAVEQKWEALRQSGEQLDIGRFKAEIDAEFPSMSKLTGKALTEFYDVIGMLGGRKPDDRHRKVPKKKRY